MKIFLFLQTMKQKKWNIPAFLLLFTFLLGTVGVNVSRVSCYRCQETYLHVVVIPEDLPCPCTHGCNSCCQHACHKVHKDNCTSSRQQHTYYKVSGDWAMSHFEIQFCDMVQACDFMMPLPQEVISNVKLFNSSLACIDSSPPQELLCIFSC